MTCHIQHSGRVRGNILENLKVSSFPNLQTKKENFREVVKALLLESVRSIFLANVTYPKVGESLLEEGSWCAKHLRQTGILGRGG